MQKKYFDFSDLLKIGSIAIFAITFLLYKDYEENPYENKITMILGGVLCLQIFAIQFIAKKKFNPLVLLFLYYLLGYYALRVCTLATFRHSDVMDRFEYHPTDTNFALLFIEICNLFMATGFILANKNRQKKTIKSNTINPEPAIQPVAWLGIFAISSIANAFSIFDNIVQHSRLAGDLIQLLRPGILLFPAFIYFTYHNKSINIICKIIFLFLIILNTAQSIITGGTRGDFIYIIELLIMTSLACGNLLIRRSFFYKILLTAPFLFICLVATYNFASMQRVVHEHDSLSKLERIQSNLYGAVTNDQLNSKVLNIDRIFSRVGFLDFSAEIIAHSEKYAEIFNAKYYSKSIVDNLLTPGFDVYDTPKVSTALIFKYLQYNDGIPSKKSVNNDGRYHSDQIGIYGEFYALFGWYSLPILIIFTYSIGCVYFTRNVRLSDFEVVLKRALILYFFSRFFNSFGIDWTLAEAWPYIVSSCAFALILRISTHIKPIKRNSLGISLKSGYGK